jgi:hypothetical protein
VVASGLLGSAADGRSWAVGLNVFGVLNYDEVSKILIS